MQVQFGLGKGLVGCVLQVLFGEASQADETRMEPPSLGGKPLI
jgi:hypothetical protein